MMWLTVALLGVILIGLWFITGLFNRRMDDRDRQLQDFYEETDRNIEADNAGTGSDLDQRVRDKWADSD